jgi:hypothetical protein
LHGRNCCASTQQPASYVEVTALHHPGIRLGQAYPPFHLTPTVRQMIGIIYSHALCPVILMLSQLW